MLDVMSSTRLLTYFGATFERFYHENNSGLETTCNLRLERPGLGSIGTDQECHSITGR